MKKQKKKQKSYKILTISFFDYTAFIDLRTFLNYVQAKGYIDDRAERKYDIIYFPKSDKCAGCDTYMRSNVLVINK